MEGGWMQAGSSSWPARLEQEKQPGRAKCDNWPGFSHAGAQCIVAGWGGQSTEFHASDAVPR